MSELERHMINDALRLARLYWGYSQIELAKKINVSQSIISEIERKSKTVSMDLLEKYSKGLGIRMSQLILFAEELEGEPIRYRGRLLIANNALNLLEKLAPKDRIVG